MDSRGVLYKTVVTNSSGATVETDDAYYEYLCVLSEDNVSLSTWAIKDSNATTRDGIRRVRAVNSRQVGTRQSRHGNWANGFGPQPSSTGPTI